MTSQMHLYVLASGSKGNAAVVEGPEGSVLVDCGLSRRELHRRAKLVGCDLGRVCAVLVTHEHSDHVSGLPVIAKHFDGPIYTTAGTAAARSSLASLPLTAVTHSCQLQLGGMRIQAFPLSHDVADPMCFRFETEHHGTVTDAIAWATDTGQLTPEALGLLRDCRILGIEANHDPRMLVEGPYPSFLKARVGGNRGHLSNRQAAEALPQLLTDSTQAVVAMHVSEKNNLPRLAKESLASVVKGQAEVLVASQTTPLVIW